MTEFTYSHPQIPQDLPRWAKHREEVVWLAERDYAFLCDIFRAEEGEKGFTQYKRHLAKIAKQRYMSAFGMRESDF